MIPNVSDSFWRPKEVSLIFGMMALPLLAIAVKPINDFQERYIALSGIFVSGLFLWKVLFPLMINQNFKVKIFLWTYIPSLTAVFSVFFIIFLIRYFNSHSWIIIAKFICASALILSLYALWQGFLGDPVLTSRNQSKFTYRFIGTFGNPTALANYLAVCSPFFLMFKKGWYRIGFLLTCLPVVLSKSFGSLAGVLVGLIIILFFSGKKYKASILFVLLSAGLLVMVVNCPQWLSLDDRIRMWKIVLSAFKASPWIGNGLGSTAGWFAYQGAPLGHLFYDPHNFLILVLFETGILGVLVFAYALRCLMLKVWTAEKNSLLVGYLASFLVMAFVSLFNPQLAPIQLLAILNWAAIESLT